MNKKLLLGLGLFAIPFMAYADPAAQFTLYNQSPNVPSIPNPITITGGYITYNFTALPPIQLPEHCLTPVTVNLNDPSSGIALPISIKYGAGVSFTFKSLPSDCFVKNSDGSPGSWASVGLYITQLEGKINKQGTCATGASLMSSDSTSAAGLIIMEATDNSGNLDSFTCVSSQLIAIKK